MIYGRIIRAHIIIKSNTQQRVVHILACRRINFSHTHLEIAKTLNKIHISFSIDNKKITSTVTDNAKNVYKVFQIFSHDDENGINKLFFLNMIDYFPSVKCLIKKT